MTLLTRFRGLPWIDLVLIGATLGSTSWVATRGQLDIEAALGLCSTQWLWEVQGRWMTVQAQMAALRAGPPPPSLRQRYAAKYPRSPIAWVNRLPVMTAIWKRCSDFQEDRVTPLFTIASVGLGLIALRRPGNARARWRAGRVAAAIAALLPALAILEEYLLRRMNLMTYGADHDTMFGSWGRDGAKVAMAIAAAWLVLLCGGRFRVGRGWREWLGLALGAAWLVDLLWLTLLEPIAQLAP